MSATKVSTIVDPQPQAVKGKRRGRKPAPKNETKMEKTIRVWQPRVDHIGIAITKLRGMKTGDYECRQEFVDQLIGHLKGKIEDLEYFLGGDGGTSAGGEFRFESEGED